MQARQGSSMQQRHNLVKLQGQGHSHNHNEQQQQQQQLQPSAASSQNNFIGMHPVAVAGIKGGMTPLAISNTQTKIRKASAHRLAALQQQQQIQYQGDVSTKNPMTQSKERKVNNPTMLAKVAQKQNYGGLNLLHSSGIPEEFGSNKIQAKKTSKAGKAGYRESMVYFGKDAGVGQKLKQRGSVNRNHLGNPTSDQIYNYTDETDDLQDLHNGSDYNYFGGQLRDQDLIDDFQEEGADVMKVEDYNDSSSLTQFFYNNSHPLVGDSPNQHHNVPDYGGNTSANAGIQAQRSSKNYSRKNHISNLMLNSSDYTSKGGTVHHQEMMQMMGQTDDQGFKVPAFLGRASIDYKKNQDINAPAGKEQFYMTQLLNNQGLFNSSSKPRNLNNKTVIMNSGLGISTGSLSSANMRQASRAASKMKSSSTAAVVVVAPPQQQPKSINASYLAKQYATAGHSYTAKKKKQQYCNGSSSNLTSANTTMLPPTVLDNANENMGLLALMGEMAVQKGEANLIRESLGNRMSDAYAMNGNTYFGQHNGASQKDFFNSTAPINMSKLFGNTSKQHQMPHDFPGGRLSGEGVNSTQNLGRLNSKDSIGSMGSQYYVGNNNTNNLERSANNNSRLKSGSLQHTISPVKTAKKQMLIQSILNQDMQKKQGSGKYFLNMTLQQLIQQNTEVKNLVAGDSNKQIVYPSNSNEQIGFNQTQQKQRLNKTLDNLLKPHDYMTAAAVAASIGYRQEPPSKKSKAQQPPTTGQYQQQQHLQLIGGEKGQVKSKFSSTMRISDFNQTQQFIDFKNTNDILKHEMPQSTQYLQSLGRGDVAAGRASGGRKQKNSLKSTQNLNLQGNLPGDDRKVSAMSIYDQNMAQSTTSQYMMMHQQISKTATKKSSSKLATHNLQEPQPATNNTEQVKAKVSQHRKQSSQCDNEKEMLKKMMNFYQDDFLTKFKLPVTVGGQQNINNQQQIPFSNTRLSINNNNAKGTAMGFSGKPELTAGPISKSASKNQMISSSNVVISGNIQGNKHKAHSTLNQYLHKSNSKVAQAFIQPNQKALSGNGTDFLDPTVQISAKQAPLRDVTTNGHDSNYASAGGGSALIKHQLHNNTGDGSISTSQQNFILHPYNYFKLQKTKQVAYRSGKGFAVMRKEGTGNNNDIIPYDGASTGAGVNRDFQNKTQPIPKSVLDMANQAVNQMIISSGTGQLLNLSSGASIVGQKRASQARELQSEALSNHGIYNNKSKIGPGSKELAGIQVQEKANKVHNIHIKNFQKNSSQPINIQQVQESLCGNGPSEELKQGQGTRVSQKAMKKEEDPRDVYRNKKTMILDPEMLSAANGFNEVKHDVFNHYRKKDTTPDDSSDFNDNNEIDENSQSSSESDGNVQLNKFVLGKQIGQGAYAVVRVASRKRDSKKFAIKVYDKSKLTDANRQRSVRREIKLLQKMNHPNIVKIYEAFETDDYVYLVMEYVCGGSLHSYLREKSHRKLDEDDAKRIFKQILTALQYCHRKSIAHRDIKLENILLDENNNVKLIDFGFSTCIPNDKKIKMFCGTPSYMAPEIVLKEEYAGPPADIWASAVLLYSLMNGCFPFRGATDKELYRRIQRGTFVLHNQAVSDQFVELLSLMLNTTADDRPSAEDILFDPWFDSNLGYRPSNALAMKSHAENIADQKRQFKEKILGKIPVEKTSNNTICINSSLDLSKRIDKPAVNLQNGINPSSLNPTQHQQPSGQVTNTEFSDYGLQHSNVMKRLNQEAYQAYYNTSGANFGMSGTGTVQNPYYNNFFQNNYVGQQHQQPPTLSNGIYSPNNDHSAQQQNGQTMQQQSKNGNDQIPSQSQQNNQQQPNSAGTPQVFGTPTGASFNLSGGLINNNFNIPCSDKLHNWLEMGKDKQVNFNIINNIIMNTQQTPQTQQQTGGVTQGGACLSPGMQQRREQDNNDHPISPPVDTTAMHDGNLGHNEEGEIDDNEDQSEDLDDEIVDSIAKLGFNRSQVVNQLLKMTQVGSLPHSKLPFSSQIGQLYTRLKEDKLSKTSSNHNAQGRALSQQPPNRKPFKSSETMKLLGMMNHNYGVYPNYLASMPEDTNSGTEGSQGSHKDDLDYLYNHIDHARMSNQYNAVEEAYNCGKSRGQQITYGNDDYNMKVVPTAAIQKSPRLVNSGGMASQIQVKQGSRFK